MKITTRRQFLKLSASTLAMVPILSISGKAFAARNDSMRASLKYQEKPGPDGKACGGCMQFLPGKAPTALGGCKLYPGDTEITPTGYCIAWMKKA